MNGILEKISLCHRLYLACLAGAAAFLAAAGVYFVRRNVREAIECLTGRRARREIRRLERENQAGQEEKAVPVVQRRWMERATELLTGGGRDG